MGDRNRRGEAVKDRHCAQNSLKHDSGERTDGKPADRRTFFCEADPNGEKESQKSDRGRDDAVGVLKADASHHGRRQAPVGKRPVRYGEAGIRTRDKASDEKKNQSGKDKKLGEPVFRGINP